MKRDNRIFLSILWVICGAVLTFFSIRGELDSFWSGMGAALLCVGAAQILRFCRFQKNEAYRERMEIAESDERLRFIRAKAWSWAGYLFILISAVGVIVFKIVGQEILSMAASYAVCLMMILYWVTYMILKKKY